ncbi:MAG: two-component system LytT family sensor kinase [Crocinitomicaceae bacterium]|jgi:two-component system LytT family sensor kinase
MPSKIKSRFDLMRAKGIYWVAQLIGWLAYASLVLIAVFNNDPEKVDSELFINLTALVVCGILISHIQRSLMIRLGWLDKKLTGLIPRLIISSVISAVLINICLYSVDYLQGMWEAAYPSLKVAEPRDPFKASQFIVSSISLGILILFWNAIYFTYHFFQKSRKQEISNLELTSSNRESELKNLRSQLNPHFLFNSLNSIRALVDLEPAKAKVSITTLSNLLRQSLILGRENIVTIDQELDISRSYLDLEKIRFEERLEVRWEIDTTLLERAIPPFSLQMMVENAVKHGISSRKEGGEVVVSIVKENDGFVIQVANSGVLGATNDMGVGIQNIQQRLKLQYGENAKFWIKQEGDNVLAKIKFTNEGI